MQLYQHKKTQLDQCLISLQFSFFVCIMQEQDFPCLFGYGQKNAIKSIKILIKASLCMIVNQIISNSQILKTYKWHNSLNFLQSYLQLVQHILQILSQMYSHSKNKAQKLENFPKGPNDNDLALIQENLRIRREQNKELCRKTPRAIEALFIGPRGQNADYFKELITQGIWGHITARKSYEMDDSRHITREMKSDKSFMEAQDSLDKSYSYLLTKLRDLSPPYYSSRYYGHMCWQTSIPSMIGYFSTMLYNPNNTAFEASPLTTQLEIDCMKEFAEMFQYPPMILSKPSVDDGIAKSWGHFTCGGTVANCQAFWAARSVKFLAFGLKKYIESLQKEQKKRFDKVRDVEVKLITGEMKLLTALSVWELLNVGNDETMSLYDRIFKMIYSQNNNKQEENYSQFQNGLAPFTVGMEGLIDVYNMMEEENEKCPDHHWPKNKVPKPISFISATGHYSLPKAVSLIGIGESCLKKIQVDLNTRIDTTKLEAALNQCACNHTPVLVVVGIVGSTQESTVDNLKEILAIKGRMAKKGLFFHFHIDGAYGSYFVSMIRKVQQCQLNSINNYVKQQLSQFCYSDSITFDPHKTGYVPYSCGGIFYRNNKLRENLSFSAPVIYTGVEPNVAIYGIEGSKPGASVSAVYLSLEIMPLQRSGHGYFLERTMVNSKIFTASLYGMRDTQFSFTLANGNKYKQFFNCCVLPRDYVNKFNCPQEKEAQDAAYRKISRTKLTDIPALINNDPSIGKYYYEVGPDLNIVCYCVNFIDKKTGKWNTSLKKLNEFNKTLVKISKPVGGDVSIRCKDLYVSETEITRKYGDDVFDDFLNRHGLCKDDQSIEFIRSTIMNPFFTEQNSQTPNSIFINQLAENSCETLDLLVQKQKGEKCKKQCKCME